MYKILKLPNAHDIKNSDPNKANIQPNDFKKNNKNSHIHYSADGCMIEACAGNDHIKMALSC
jgi:hypothetical protein